MQLGAAARTIRSIPSHLRVKLARWRRLLAWPVQKREIEQRLEVIRDAGLPSADSSTLVVVCLVRDGEDHVETFVDHHLRLGAAGIVLLDNGSQDRTVERASAMDRVTVLACPLPYKTHSYAYKRYLVERFGEGRWCLLADIDERFDYPGSDSVPLAAFLGYLNACRFTAVMAHLLDLFPGGPPAAWPAGGRELIEASEWYDVSAVEPRWSLRPRLVNKFADPRMTLYGGGIRAQALGANPMLTKMPLLFRSGGATPVLESAHLCRGARIADVNGVLLHYKFDRQFGERCVKAVKEGSYFAGSAAYKHYLKALEDSPELVLRGPTARRYSGAMGLVEQGFLRASGRYLELVASSRRAPVASVSGGTLAG
jgi:hypothetical protein